ncbi:MAG: hypothetical protein GXN92_03495, partial [Candidatus Micrarchaeota archaeon]|nr:hypothetical protein [Candidatus Micrarchaeota archaeon]
EVEFEVYIPPPETNNTIVIGSTVEDESSPPPTEENITPVEEPMIEPEVPPQEKEPEIVEQPPEPQPTPAPPKEEKVAGERISTSSPNEESFPIWVLGGIVLGGAFVFFYKPARNYLLGLLEGLLLVLMLRIARVKISRDYLEFKTLWGAPIKNKTVFIAGQSYRTDAQGRVKISFPVSKKDIKIRGYLLL